MDSLQDYHFDLPGALIAQQPVEERDSSRLLHLDAGGVIHDGVFTDIRHFLRSGDVLVLNDTQVLPARMRARKASGGRVEVFLHRILQAGLAEVALRCSRTPKVGDCLSLDADPVIKIVLQHRTGMIWQARLVGDDWHGCLQRYGHMPLPPYIQRTDVVEDRQRYQTVYAHEAGAVAAPTAGLHFTRPLLDDLHEQGVAVASLTLHVGWGTFEPIRVADYRQHSMHAERFRLDQDVVDKVRRCKAQGGRVVAVGSTVTRCLESCWGEHGLCAGEGETDIFITPGYCFSVVDALITNFHLPASSLMLMVAAFAGRARIMAAYRHAIAQRYRFYSYGDAMLIEPLSPPE